MAQHPVEMILLRQWAEHMASAIWLVDVAGNLLYYNEPAEAILGMRFDEAGAINADELADLFVTSAQDGSPVDSSELPIVVALSKMEPSHKALRIRDRTGGWRDIEVTAIPIEATSGRHLGAMAVFWETGQ